MESKSPVPRIQFSLRPCEGGGACASVCVCVMLKASNIWFSIFTFEVCSVCVFCAFGI